MQDLQQTLNQLVDYVKGIWIKKRFVMICSWVICPIGFAYVASMPDQYESKAVVYVDTRSVLQPLLRGLAIQTNPDQEIQMMARTLLSRSNLETIARESDLDITAATEQEFTSLVNGLAEDIDLNSTGRDNIYTISYRTTSPNTAQRVVQETLDLFVEGSLGNNRKDTDTAGRFLDEQIAEYESRLAEAEQRLSDFKRQYNDILPVQGSFYSRLQQLNAEQEATLLQIRQTQQQVESLKNQLSSTKAADGFAVTNEGDTVLRTRYDERIKALEEEMDRLKLRFTDLHPDVMETQALLDSLTQARQKEIDAFLSQDTSDSNEPVGELNRELKLEISRLESTIASLRVKEQDLERKIADLNSKIDLVPQIEAESASLNRDYGITKQKYEELLSRRESADLSRRADVSSEELQFRIIEPPLKPLKPSGPKRVLLYTGVLIVGFGAGIALAFLISQLSPVLIRAKQLSQITDYPVWGSVSHLNVKHIRNVNRTRVAVFALSSGVILALYGVLVGAEMMSINLMQSILS
ncbi:chain-length determining protein [Alteromonas aestuariivivens]|uniref:Chain-length determining protein n=1 Tax=Alteromonas aestuariivivens TaxID=1938339 RepID=A0A3D8MEJ4_9ALTE|nr:XrtA system polysaccharide chain length determinant [Alteromonas aestuariivivens]RDV29183.1 chain-length determining protein [Alteromonas aestuariivivens]